MRQELVKIVKDHGGRFLAKCENKKMYYEIEDGDARRKALQGTSAAIRILFFLREHVMFNCYFLAALRENKWN